MPYTYVCVTSSRSHSSCVVTSREGLRSFLTLCSGPVCSHSLGIATSRKCLSSLRERFARWLITHHTRVHVSRSPPMLPAHASSSGRILLVGRRPRLPQPQFHVLFPFWRKTHARTRLPSERIYFILFFVLSERTFYIQVKVFPLIYKIFRFLYLEALPTNFFSGFVVSGTHRHTLHFPLWGSVLIV